MIATATRNALMSARRVLRVSRDEAAMTRFYSFSQARSALARLWRSRCASWRNSGFLGEVAEETQRSQSDSAATERGWYACDASPLLLRGGGPVSLRTGVGVLPEA